MDSVKRFEYRWAHDVCHLRDQDAQQTVLRVLNYYGGQGWQLVAMPSDSMPSPALLMRELPAENVESKNMKA